MMWWKIVLLVMLLLPNFMTGATAQQEPLLDLKSPIAHGAVLLIGGEMYVSALADLCPSITPHYYSEITGAYQRWRDRNNEIVSHVTILLFRESAREGYGGVQTQEFLKEFEIKSKSDLWADYKNNRDLYKIRCEGYANTVDSGGLDLMTLYPNVVSKLMEEPI